MRKTALFFTCIILLFYVNILKVFSQKGYPERNNIKNLFTNFQNPPEGYGEVPFYWWQADTLTKERLIWQLDELAKKKISSLQINYSHSDDKKGYFWGSSVLSVPAQFSEEWWELFGWFMQEASKRNMTVSVSDYTLGLGQGYALDEVRSLCPDIIASVLNFEKKEIHDGKIQMKLNKNLVSLVAYKLPINDMFIDLTDKVVSSYIEWSNEYKDWLVVATYANPQERTYNPMHPLSGKEYVRCFFQRFEDKFPETSKGNLNFFFSDELEFNIKGFAWDERFVDEFKKRKGYDIIPYLAALNTDIGKITSKIRLDYNDVFTSLSEENFFIPVYKWHADRNLIFGCDHGGRGRHVDEFGDYFRTQRWNQGPGSDQPRLERDIVRAKVAASIAHLYERPRVWLEGFYSSGWGTTSADLMDAIFANYAMGYNLLSLHGLYYATPGSMWEWAPPCNHFRMPYWETMDKTLDVTERLSYLFSQGYHSCDVAVLYPVEPKIAGYNNSAISVAFNAGEILYKNGIDFDFIDYSSLQKATVENGELKISNEKYKVIIVPSMEAIKDSSIRQLGIFAQNGGKIINIGKLPEATDKYGICKDYVEKLVSKMSSGANYVEIDNTNLLLSVLDKLIIKDFYVVDNTSLRMPYINHRKIDDKDIYGVYNVEKGSKCFFRSKGKVEFWDVMEGTKIQLTDVFATNDGTVVTMPQDVTSFQIIVFTPSSNADIKKHYEVCKVMDLDNEWESEIIPVLDNRFGDFHYPGTPDKLLPEIRHYKYLYSLNDKIKDLNFRSDKHSCEKVTYTYGTEFVCSGATNQQFSDDYLAGITTIPDSWKPYEFSRKWGVYNDAGHQGYHGLKMEMNPEVIKLGRLKHESTRTVRLEEEGGKYYYLYTKVKAPYSGEYEIVTGKKRPSRCFVNGKKLSSQQNSLYLNKGENHLILCYEGPTISYFFIQDPKQKNKLVERLTLPWHNDTSILPFSPYETEKGYGWYFFESAPGLTGFSVGVKGKTQVWVDGKRVKVQQNGDKVNVTLNRILSKPASVLMRVKLPFGVYGGSGIQTELVQHTAKGIIYSGDWGEMDGLMNYSGAIKYSQTVNLSRIDKSSERISLKISDLSSSVKLFINGQYVGTRVCPNWEFDITDYVTEGENKVEMIIYNTAANHYETIPTQFKGKAPSGLLGNVKIEYLKTK